MPGWEARHRDAALTNRLHERLEWPCAEHQHLSLDAALRQSRQELEEMALRACDAAGHLLDMQNTDSRCPPCGGVPYGHVGAPHIPGLPKRLR